MEIYDEDSHRALISPIVYIKEPVCLSLGGMTFTRQTAYRLSWEYQPRGGAGRKHTSVCSKLVRCLPATIETHSQSSSQGWGGKGEQKEW